MLIGFKPISAIEIEVSTTYVPVALNSRLANLQSLFVTMHPYIGPPPLLPLGPPFVICHLFHDNPST